MRARKQRELGGLAAFLILIWIIIGFPTRVNFKLTAATAGFTITTTTKTYFDKHEIYRSTTNNNGTVIQDKEDNQINILMDFLLQHSATRNSCNSVAYIGCEMVSSACRHEPSRHRATAQVTGQRTNIFPSVGRLDKSHTQKQTGTSFFMRRRTR